MGKANNPHEGVQYRGDYSGAPTTVPKPASPHRTVSSAGGVTGIKEAGSKALGTLRQAPIDRMLLLSQDALNRNRIGILKQDSTSAVVFRTGGAPSSAEGSATARRAKRNPHE